MSSLWQKTEIFGQGGGEELASKSNVPFLGKIPLEVQVREGGDLGIPSFFLEENSEVKTAFENISKKLAKILSSESS